MCEKNLFVFRSTDCMDPKVLSREVWQQVLRHNHVTIVTRVSVTGNVLARMFQWDVFTEADVEEIKGKRRKKSVFKQNMDLSANKAPSVPFSLFFTLDSFSVILLLAQCTHVKAFNTKDLNTLTSVHLISNVLIVS